MSGGPKSKAQRDADLAEAKQNALRRIHDMTPADRTQFLGWQALHDPYILLVFMDRFWDEVEVARVANAPVGGREELSKEK